jgi:nucleoside phosphorylase
MPRHIESKDLLIDFAIVTAVKMERIAVCSEFGFINKVRKGGRVYWRGRLPLEDGNFYEIIVVQAADAASVDASITTYDTITHWSPGALLLVGFAGAAHDGTEDDHEALGDVIVASDVYYYDRGKETENGKLPEAQMIKADPQLWHNVVNLEEWKPRISVRRPDHRRVVPRVFEGVIACGERVIASETVRNAIVAQHRKIRAIEMEGYAFSKTAWASAERRIPYLVMKAICDRADRGKGDDWQPYAAAAAASFAKHFLLDRPLEPRNLGRVDNGSPNHVGGANVGGSGHKLLRRDTSDLEINLPKINFKKAFAAVDEVFSKIKDGGAALFLVQDGLTMGGQWCAAHVKDLLRGDSGTGKFKYWQIEFSTHQRLNEQELIIRIADYMGIKGRAENLPQFMDEVIDRLCGSLRVGSTIFIELRISHNLSVYDNFLSNVVSQFWKPLTRKIESIRSNISLAKVVFFILANSTLPRLGLDTSIFCTRREFNQEKILELRLEKWTEDEIRTWLYKFSSLELTSSEHEVMASSIYRSSTNGLPIAVYNLLLDSFA